MSLWWAEKKTVDAHELEQLYHRCLSFHPSLLSLSLSNYLSLEHLPLTLGLSRSLLYPLVGNQPHARKQSHTHTHRCTHTHSVLQHHRAERSVYQRSLVFQVVISSHCCSPANQKSHKPMRVIISPSGKKGPASLWEDTERCVCVCYVICIMIEFAALSNKMARLDLFQSFAYRRGLISIMR